MNDPENQPDKLLCQPIRLSVIAHLARHQGEASFVSICRELGITNNGQLSAHNDVLERSGYIALRRSFIGRKTHTRLILTEMGRAAFARHRAALSVVLNFRPEAEMAA